MLFGLLAVYIVPPFADKCFLIEDGSIWAKETLYTSLVAALMINLASVFNVSIKSRRLTVTGKPDMWYFFQNWVIFTSFSGNSSKIRIFVIFIIVGKIFFSITGFCIQRSILKFEIGLWWDNLCQVFLRSGFVSLVVKGRYCLRNVG
ncbi:hypothetical protein X975_24525, partial [Stegodyphus mimosarum]